MLVDDIVEYLGSAGLGLTVGTNLWKLPVPETATSGNQVGVIEYGGRPSLRAMGPSLSEPVMEITRFQVAVIAPTIDAYSTGRDLIENIYKKLDNLADTTLGSTRYLHVRALQPPFYMPPGETGDANAQHHFSCNFECVKVRG